jgi:hypothetical protein
MSTWLIHTYGGAMVGLLAGAALLGLGYAAITACQVK